MRGNLALSIITRAISLLLDQFKDAYDCAGPVIINALPYSRQDLMNMNIGDPARCTLRPYNFQTK